jgi:hypothetical protein
MTDETVIGVIPTARIKTGFFASKALTLVFTNQRLILAEMTKDLVNAEIERSRAAAKEQGGGFLSQWGAQLKSSFSFGSHYLGADPAAILAERPGNSALGPGDVRGIRIERQTRSSGSDDDVTEQQFLRITIETAAGKQTYATDAEKPKLDEARALAASVFGPAVR